MQIKGDFSVHRVALLLAVLLALVGCGDVDTVEKQQQVRAFENAKALEFGLEMYQERHGYMTGVKPGTSPEETNRIVMKELLNPKDPFFRMGPDDLDASGAFLDPWGRPYLVQLASPGTGRIKVGSKVLKRRWAVWSSGMNRVNEWGEGDDICTWKSQK